MNETKFNPQALHTLRKEHEMSQREFARAINTSKQSVSQWELGDSRPGLGILERLCRVFGKEQNYFFTEEEFNVTTFIATTEERYAWTCPYCKSICEDDCEYPEDQESVTCEHCGKESKCERTDR